MRAGCGILRAGTARCIGASAFGKCRKWFRGGLQIEPAGAGNADVRGRRTGGALRERINPLAHEADGGRRGTANPGRAPVDEVITAPAPGRTPTLDFSFEGIGNPTACSGCVPPDTNGDVGPNHYIQMVNATKVGIYNKTGTLLTAAFNLGTL